MITELRLIAVLLYSNPTQQVMQWQYEGQGMCDSLITNRPTKLVKEAPSRELTNCNTEKLQMG